jgi:5-amino-6-(5-phosphoribosylamino)uracil reductase/diaminohydroxyphosphoribosylaminopyrimidine deaminase/5-amino-6-(5-phosphoribosylamino)uracil reductase
MARPLVTLHFAQSLDGRIGLGPGQKRAILSSEEGVRSAHRARSQHDAVLIGVETLLSDDPLLTARDGGPARPLRVVLDSELRTPPTARLLEPNAQAGQVVIFGCAARAASERQQELAQRGAQVQLTGADQRGRVALPEVLDALAQQGVRRLLVEGGATVITSFLQGRLAARAEVEVSPLLLGAPATPALQELGVDSLLTALRLERVEVERLGQSVLMCGDISYPARSD